MDKTSKNQRICNYGRSQHGLIKLPTWRRGINPWRILVPSRSSSPNPDAENGGLAHDDFIDTVAMSMFVVRGTHDAQTASIDDGGVLTIENPLEEIAGGN
jgi:hypothetical protein